MNTNRLLRILMLGLMALGLSAFNLLLHEFGHCLTMERLDGTCEGIYLPPGIKVWPLADFGAEYGYLWDGYAALTVYGPDWAQLTDAEYGLTMLMGSGTPALLALFALLSLYILRPSGRMEKLLMLQALFFGDMLLYVILPEWFGLRHFFFVGGATPEPLDGAVLMGFERGGFIAGVLVFSALMSAGWIGYLCLRRSGRPPVRRT